MDKLKKIRILLEKFYAGSTSREEEAELTAYLTGEDIPGEFAADAELFRSMEGLNQPVDIPADLDNKIISGLDEQERAETRVRRISIYSFSGLAAGLLIILSVYLGLVRNNQDSVVSQYAIEDPERAYIEAKRALEYVSLKWNEGTRELDNLNQVNKTMETVSTINKISSGSRELNLLGNLNKANQIEIQ